MSDQEVRIERVNSVEEAIYDKVPENKVFTLTFKDKEQKTYKILEYVLKEGRFLPYNVNLKGKEIVFNRFLKPHVKQMSLLSEEDGANFVFQDTDDPEISLESDSEEISSTPNDDLKKLLLSSKSKDRDSFAPFSCPFCANKFVILVNARKHVEVVHPDWGRLMSRSVRSLELLDLSHSFAESNQGEGEEDKLEQLIQTSETNKQSVGESTLLHVVETNVLEAGVEETGMVDTVVVDVYRATEEKTLAHGSKEKAERRTVHNNPNWFREMTVSFQDSVVNSCSKLTKDAIAGNVDIQDLGDRAKVMKEILKETVIYLEKDFGTETPQQKHTKQVHQLLSDVYPSMFKESVVDGPAPSYSGYGLGGLRGLKGLPERICNLFRDRHRGTNKRTATKDDTEVDLDPKKKGRKGKVVYGVNNQKFYASSSNKKAFDALKQAGKLDTFEEREEVLDSNRDAVMKLIRDNTGSIAKTCDALFKDPRHLKGHFYYLTQTDIQKKIEKNLAGHLENMEIYLTSMNDSLELAEDLEKINDECSLEFGGGKIHKFIWLLRTAGDHFDKDDSALLRVQADGAPKTASPHIFAVRVGLNYHFELWVEMERVLESMELTEAVAAFLHLAFCFNLSYPKEAETVCDFIQREVAEYGNDEGTKTNKSKVTAISALTRYHIQLGRALGARNLK